MGDVGDLDAVARGIIDGNRYMALGTADETGRPWVSPVYFAPDGYRALYWLSSPDAQHSRNVAVRPEVFAAVFDSQVAVHRGLPTEGREQLVGHPLDVRVVAGDIDDVDRSGHGSSCAAERLADI